ncbi:MULTISPECIES: FUSC family protein [unclassified Streptomyces]|uniref:FUSC family protein n=1 Tax=unclassified Streptomyces TaxID=2593676 RepID=UPI00036F6FC8|nr:MULTISPECIES: FUSC family protein [unclassified Streptomyces]MYT30000.1 FUSC family protein [Streptomyces sp. SID8354]
MPRHRRAVPAWLAHPFRWQRLPVPWAAVARGALCAGPLLAVGIAAGRPAAGVLAALGSMLAGVNDRPGTRRTGIVHIGLPALATAFGMLVGASLRAADAGWWTVPALCAVGFVSGAGSVAGPVRSTAGMQMLAATVLGAGMPLPGAPWTKALYVLAGCLWLLLLRLALRSPRPAGGPLSGERAVVATVFDALADALAAVGGPGAEPARRRLTAALDRADEALRLRRLTSRLLRRPARPEELLLAERFAAATALCEASVALLWEARPLPPRVAASPRRFARALRTGQPPGRLSAPENSSAARGAFDHALLDAAVAFARERPLPETGERTPPARPTGTRGALGPAARDYGLRVALCIGASAAVALLLRADHWYWLPATVTFLVKPDLGPLFSRTVNRFAGTAAGVLVFAAAAALLSGSWWPAVFAGAGGALLPFATRHFALQTSAITVMVLSFVYVGGAPEAAGERLVDTSLACAIVLVVGHLPRLADPRRRVGPRVTEALRSTERFLHHVLAPRPAADPAGTGAVAARRLALRRDAYRTLAQARAAAETAAAEFRPGRDPGTDWPTVVAAAERIVDAATACAVRLDRGAHRPGPDEAARLCQALLAMADALEDPRRRPPGTPQPELRPVPDCATLTDVAAELERLRGYAAAR